MHFRCGNGRPLRILLNLPPLPDRPTSCTFAGPGAGLSPELRAALDEYVAKHKVVVFMKGTAQFPQCGFSNTVVQIMNQMQCPFQV